MPKFNGTGPMGYGPGTGRGLGPCCTNGYGYGRKLRRFASTKNELKALKEEKEMLEDELKALNEEILSLEKEDK